MYIYIKRRNELAKQIKDKLKQINRKILENEMNK